MSRDGFYLGSFWKVGEGQMPYRPSSKTGERASHRPEVGQRPQQRGFPGPAGKV